jgi:hypothetical protein
LKTSVELSLHSYRILKKGKSLVKADNYQPMLAQIRKRMDELRRLDNEQASRNYAHLYCMNPPLSASRIAVLEQQYQVSLPEEYCLFFQEIGNGSTDRSWGLFPLEEALQCQWDEEEEEESRPDYFREPFVPPVSLADADDSDGWGGPGLLILEHTGCGECSYLAVSGAEYGHIWQGQPDWLYPAFTPSQLPDDLRTINERHDYLLSCANPPRLTFLSWWYQRLCGGW